MPHKGHYKLQEQGKTDNTFFLIGYYTKEEGKKKVYKKKKKTRLFKIQNN